jgi:hypothetical protein
MPPSDLEQKVQKLEKDLETIQAKLDYANFRYDHVMQAVLEHMVTQTTELRLLSGSPVVVSTSENKPHHGLCSESYAKILNNEHSKESGWGVTASNNLGSIVEFLRKYQIVDFLDYGCGSGNRLKLLLDDRHPGEFVVTEYDPGIPAYAKPPPPASGVVCIDVLEHVEPEFIDNVLDDLKRVTLNHGYFMISLLPATRLLQNGKNAHLIVEDASWWEQKLSERFSLVHVSKNTGQMSVVVSSL